MIYWHRFVKPGSLEEYKTGSAHRQQGDILRVRMLAFLFQAAMPVQQLVDRGWLLVGVEYLGATKLRF